MTLSTAPWWCAPVLAFGWITTVPAQSFSAPARACVMAAARFIPGVWAVLTSSSFEWTTRTPSNFHLGLLAMANYSEGHREEQDESHTLDARGAGSLGRRGAGERDRKMRDARAGRAAALRLRADQRRLHQGQRRRRLPRPAPVAALPGHAGADDACHERALPRPGGQQRPLLRVQRALWPVHRHAPLVARSGEALRAEPVHPPLARPPGPAPRELGFRLWPRVERTVDPHRGAARGGARLGGAAGGR